MAENEAPVENAVVVRTGRIVKIGEARLHLRDEYGLAPYVDLLTEVRCSDGVVAVSLAQGVWDNGNLAEAVMGSRFRMPLTVAQAFRDILSDVIKEALKPVDQSKAN